MPVLPQRPFGGRRAAFTPKDSYSDDEDAITPCSSPPPEPQELLASSSSSSAEPQQSASPPSFTPSRRPSASAAASSRKQSMTQEAWHFDPAQGQAMDDSQLWSRMLEIQRVFHCYNSARMSAALLELEMGGDAGHLAPSRSCLDLMNESISDLGHEEKQRLVDWVHDHSSRKRKSQIWRRSFNL